MPDMRRPWNWLASDGDRGGAPPASRRLAQNLRDHDITGERSIAVAQGAIAFLILLLHAFARHEAGDAMFDPWVAVAVGLLLASSCLRWVLANGQGAS